MLAQRLSFRTLPAFLMMAVVLPLLAGCGYNTIPTAEENAKAAWSDIQPLTHGFYANSITGRTSAMMQGTYGGNYERLALIKKKFDPMNLLRMNANVIPAT